MSIDDARIRKLITLHMVVAVNVMLSVVIWAGLRGEDAKAAFAKSGKDIPWASSALISSRWWGFLMAPMMIGALIVWREKEPAVAWRLGIAYAFMALSGAWFAAYLLLVNA